MPPSTRTALLTHALIGYEERKAEIAERNYLGMMTGEDELAPLEEHILACVSRVERAVEVQKYPDAMRVILLGPGIPNAGGRENLETNLARSRLE